jgi:hypothetical protein
MCRGLSEIANIVIRNYAAADKDSQFSAETCEILIKQKDLGITPSSPSVGTTVNDQSTSILAKNPDKSQETQNLVKQLPVRVYIQIFDEQDRGRAREFQKNLRTQGFLAPGIENVGDETGNKANRLEQNVIRVYNDADYKVAENKIQGIVGRDFMIQQKAGNANKGSIEVWFKTP